MHVNKYKAGKTLQCILWREKSPITKLKPTAFCWLASFGCFNKYCISVAVSGMQDYVQTSLIKKTRNHYHAVHTDSDDLFLTKEMKLSRIIDKIIYTDLTLISQWNMSIMAIKSYLKHLICMDCIFSVSVLSSVHLFCLFNEVLWAHFLWLRYESGVRGLRGIDFHISHGRKCWPVKACSYVSVLL